MRKTLVYIIAAVGIVALSWVALRLLSPITVVDGTPTPTSSPVDLSNVPDGRYRGEYTFGGFTYAVEVAIVNHRMTAITVLQNLPSEHARQAEGVIPRVLAAQSPDVDAVTGATFTSQSLLQAIADALTKATGMQVTVG